MGLRKYRWSKHYESSEEELIALLDAKHIEAKRWEIESYENIAEQKHDYNKKLWCVEGSAVLTLGSQEFSMQTGDALDVPTNTSYKVTAGFTGFACYEAKA